MASRRVKVFLRTATPALASLLAGLMLLLGMLSASDELHRIFHQNGNDGSNLCVACLLLKGLVNSPDLGPVLTVPLPSLLCMVPQANGIVLPDFSYLGSASRAPPVSASLFAVVA
jgi:hypothetical protein